MVKNTTQEFNLNYQKGVGHFGFVVIPDRVRLLFGCLKI